MIELQVNGDNQRCRSTTLASLLEELGYQGAVVATALNGNFVAQGQRQTTNLSQGDSLEILAPMQGG